MSGYVLGTIIIFLGFVVLTVIGSAGIAGAAVKNIENK